MKIKDRNGDSYEVRVVTSKDMEAHLSDIANFRITYFRNYPYLYIGDPETESSYIQGFASCRDALLLMLFNNDTLVGVSTSMPLNSESDILGQTPKLFSDNGLNIDDFYYVGEVIIAPEYQCRGLARELLQIQEEDARRLDFTKITLATVVRDKNHPLKPRKYRSSESLWPKLGYRKIDSLVINYPWPTILENGTVKETLNPMVFWIKDLQDAQ